MQLEAAPVLLVTLAAGLNAQAAFLGKVGDHFLQRHVLLALEPRPAFTGLCAFVRSSLGPAFAGGLGRFRGSLGAFGLIVIAGQTLTRFDGGRVARDVANDSILLGVADQCFVYFGRQAGARTRRRHAKKWLRWALARRCPSRRGGAVGRRFAGAE